MPHREGSSRPIAEPRAIITVEHINQLATSVLPPRSEETGQRTVPTNGTREAVDQAFGILALRLVPILQAHLDTLVGRTDLDNQQSADLAKALTLLAKRLNLAFECPHCMAPARALRYGKTATRGKVGWRYEHSENLKHGGSSHPPRLKLVGRKSLEDLHPGT